MILSEPRMATITAISDQKRNPDRVNVFLDGQYAFSMMRTAAARLKVGQSLTDTELARLQQDDELAKVKEKALRYLSYRPRSENELRRHLRRKGLDDFLIEQVINQLNENELLNDAAFADYWVEQRESFKPRSALALRQELQQKGVSRDVIDQALNDIDEFDAARRAASQRAPQLARLPLAQFQARLGGYLQRRGFGYGVIREVVQEQWQEWGTEEEIEL
jgi:regulatory protein